MIFKAWQEQKCIGWSQLFRGRISSKWARAQEIYYQDNPDTKEAKHFCGKIWSKQVIGKLIEISLELWVARNKELHGTTPAEQKQIQRVRTIQVVTRKYKEGQKTVREGFPRLYAEPCHLLCDKNTLQLLKWIETYNISLGSIRRKDTKRRRGYIKAIKGAYRIRKTMSKYGQITLFQNKGAYCARETLNIYRFG